MRFEERDLKPYAQPVTAKVLEQGRVYFSVQFADDDMLIPIMQTWVFTGPGQGAETKIADYVFSILPINCSNAGYPCSGSKSGCIFSQM